MHMKRNAVSAFGIFVHREHESTTGVTAGAWHVGKGRGEGVGGWTGRERSVFCPMSEATTSVMRALTCLPLQEDGSHSYGNFRLVLRVRASDLNPLQRWSPATKESLLFSSKTVATRGG